MTTNANAQQATHPLQQHVNTRRRRRPRCEMNQTEEDNVKAQQQGWGLRRVCLEPSPVCLFLPFFLLLIHYRLEWHRWQTAPKWPPVHRHVPPPCPVKNDYSPGMRTRDHHISSPQVCLFFYLLFIYTKWWFTTRSRCRMITSTKTGPKPPRRVGMAVATGAPYASPRYVLFLICYIFSTLLYLY